MTIWHAEIGWAPLLAPALLMALAVVCVVAVLPGLVRRAAGSGARLAAFAVALVFLAAPQRIVRTGVALPDIALLAVDHSGSMQVGDRAAVAEAAARKLMDEAAHTPGLQLRRVDFTDTGVAGTQMFGAIAGALAEVPPDQRAGVIAITDGAIGDPPKSFPLPLDVLIPARGEQVDRRLEVTLAPGYGIVGQSVRVGFVVRDLGTASGATARVAWRQDGVPAGTMDVTTGVAASISVKIRRAGSTTVALEVSPLAHEASLLNNRVALTINGVRDQLHVLLISGEPHEGERTWRRLLKSDPAVDLVHFTILRPPGKDDMTPLNELALIAFPIRELFVEKIRQFDLIILDRFSETGLLPPSYVQNIADYVREGGALLVSAGPEFADPTSLAGGPIGEVLPALPADGDAVVTGAFRPVVTALGRRHPVTENLPGDDPGGTPHWGQWYRRIAVSPPRGEVVMQADGAPLLILDRVGKGRVALLLSDQIWLWARGHEGGGPQGELLRRVAHWLMKQPELDENALTARVVGGRLMVERHGLTAAPPGAVVQVTDPDRRQTMVPLRVMRDGREVAAMAAPAAGLWEVRYGGRAAYAAAEPADPVEWSDLRATARVLRPLARSVRWLVPDGAPALASLPLRHSPALRLTGVSERALFPAWAALPLFLVLLLLGWRREGK